MKQFGWILVLFLAVFMPVSVAGFELGETAEAQSVCASDTLVYILPVSNTDGSADSFTVSLSGDASKWAVAAPAGFVLQAGESKSVYIYVTPSPKAQVGTYNLDVLVNSGLNGKQSKTVQVIVNDCHSATLSAEPATIQACACTPQEYSVALENTGRFTENFAISLAGSGARYATSSLSEVKLAKGESKEFKVSANTACNSIGNFGITVNAISKDSNAVASTPLGLDSQACYDFDVVPDKTYLSFCENSEAKIPIIVKSSGVVDNSFDLGLEGPSWAKLETSKLDVRAGKSENTNLVLFPSFGVAGDFKISVSATGAKGQNSVETEITANVLQCHIADLKIAAEEDTICPFTSKAYAVSLANTGRFDENYVVTVAGTDFAGLDKDIVKLTAGNSSKFNLIVSPRDVPAGEFTIRVAAEAQGPSKASSADALRIRVAPKESCFGVQTTAAQTSVDVAYGEGALIPVVVENKGRETSIYNLEVSGSGANYAELNPGTLELKGGQAQTVYLYIAVPVDAQQPDYKVTVGARLKDGTVSSSATVNIGVVRSAENQTVAVKPANKYGGAAALPAEISSLKANIMNKLRGLKNAVAGKASASLAGLKSKLGSRPQLPAELPKVELPKVQLPTTADVRARAEGDIQNIKSKFAKPEINFGLPKLELPKFEAPQAISDLRNRISQADAQLRSIIAAQWNYAKGKIAPATSAISQGKSYVRDLLNQNTYGYANWMIAGGIILVLVVLFSITVSLPKGEGKGSLGKFWDWLEEEEGAPEGKPPATEEKKPAAEEQKPARGEKGMMQKFLDWLEEDDAVEKPADAPKQETKPQAAPQEKQKETPAPATKAEKIKKQAKAKSEKK